MNTSKRDFKRVGKAMLGFWVAGTIMTLFYPYGLMGWPTVENLIELWGEFSLAFLGFAIGWFYAWVEFVWEPKR